MLLKSPDRSLVNSLYLVFASLLTLGLRVLTWKFNPLTFIVIPDMCGCIAVIWSCLLLFSPLCSLNSWQVWISYNVLIYIPSISWFLSHLMFKIILWFMLQIKKLGLGKVQELVQGPMTAKQPNQVSDIVRMSQEQWSDLQVMLLLLSEFSFVLSLLQMIWPLHL